MGGASDNFFEHTLFFFWNFWNFRNFEALNTIFVNKNAPELSVSGTALTILKIWAKNIQFEKSYGESKFGSETLERWSESRALKAACPVLSHSEKKVLFFFGNFQIDLTFFKLNIFCSDFQNCPGSIWNARIRCLFVQKISGGASDKILDHQFFSNWNLLEM